MKLKGVVLKNFRSYRDETRIEIGDLSVFIGKNDTGKSNILEALDIFFGSRTIKIETLDACVFGESSDVRIGCIFADLPDELVIDETSRTNLRDEYLLNAAGDLEIHKIFNCGLKKPKESVFAVALHPTADKVGDLLQLKRVELQTRMEELGVDTNSVDQRANPPMRKAIWESCEDLELATVEVPLDKEDAKKVWDKREQWLPTFALFRADRPSRDEDGEVQDPMKAAVLEAIKSVQEELETIKNIVQEKATAVAQATLDKLREMDPNLASELSPNFKAEPKWESLFKLALTSDDQIPMNKRGSGVRRLILLNFFRAEAERKQSETDSPGIIYAIEEPETSQHPTNQRMLVEALAELSQQEGCQVILTTHVPGLAGFLPLESLRYVTMDDQKNVEVRAGGDDVYGIIVQELGVIPDNRVRVFLCLEGPNDIRFLEQVSKMLHNHDPTLPDIRSDPRIACIPLGGQNLVQWVHCHYLEDFGRPEVHIYDRDDSEPPDYEEAVNKVNARDDESWAVLTDKREMENYLHPDAICEVFDVAVEISDETDVPLEVARAIHEAAPDAKPWAEVDDDKRGRKEKRAKRRLNSEVAEAMTVQRLSQSDPDRDIEGWLRRIAGMIQ